MNDLFQDAADIFLGSMPHGNWTASVSLTGRFDPFFLSQLAIDLAAARGAVRARPDLQVPFGIAGAVLNDERGQSRVLIESGTMSGAWVRFDCRREK